VTTRHHSPDALGSALGKGHKVTFFQGRRDRLDAFRRGDRKVLAELFHHYVGDVALVLRRGFQVRNTTTGITFPTLGSGTAPAGPSDAPSLDGLWAAPWPTTLHASALSFSMAQPGCSCRKPQTALSTLLANGDAGMSSPSGLDIYVLKQLSSVASGTLTVVPSRPRPKGSLMRSYSAKWSSRTTWRRCFMGRCLALRCDVLPFGFRSGSEGDERPVRSGGAVAHDALCDPNLPN
jgi:hypothetical protein